MQRPITHTSLGFRTQDGAGVQLVRVLSNQTADIFDPILMLDSFDSTDPKDYEAGFPMHPHRGIETISLLVRGAMTHRDSLGNEDTISDGEVQWMTAGSGILHEEVLPASERMLGVQLWLNLSAQNKMVSPDYHALRVNSIPRYEFEGGYLRVISGSFKDVQGFSPEYNPLTYYEVHLQPGASIEIEDAPDRSVMVFTLLGNAFIAGTSVEEKTAIKLGEGSYTRFEANSVDETIILYISAEKLGESIAWGGPIVMNAQEELQLAFQELQNGNFIKENLQNRLNLGIQSSTN